MAINFTGIGHIALRSKSFSEMDKFYTEKLELKKAFELKDEDGNMWITYYKLPNDQFVEVFPEEIKLGGKIMDDKYVGDNKQSDRSHFHCCFEIDARHEAYRDLEAKGVKFGHTDDDSVGMCGSWCSFVEDPEGNQWELMEFSPISKQILHLDENMNYKGE